MPVQIKVKRLKNENIRLRMNDQVNSVFDAVIVTTQDIA